MAQPARPALPPLEFPTFIVWQGEITPLPVACADGVYERPCLRSQSGQVYELGRQLREAIYGSVMHGIILQDTGHHYVRVQGGNVAIKRMHRETIERRRGRTQEDPLKEIAAMQFISYPGHPNVLRQIECVEDAENIYSIMPYCNGGELFDHVAESGALEEEMARQLFLQILAGLEYLQQMGICHRDMSLENLLLNAENQCVIIDLGMCLRIPRDQATNEFTLLTPQGVCGKRNYISPEVVQNARPFDGFAIDMWAMGVILFIMLTGVPPVDLASEVDARYRMIREGQLPQLLEQWNFHLSPGAVDLLVRLLQPDWTQRLTLAEVVAHPWVNGL